MTELSTQHRPLRQLKLDPPTVSAGCDPDQWSAFTRQWDMYKVGMAITDNVLPTALFYCCNTDLRTDIMRDLRQDVATMAEEDLLAAIKRLAVKDESILVHCIKLNKMTQSPGTGVRTFLANLRGQASLCQYKATCKELGCTHVFDYSDEIIKDNLIRGIADPKIMSDLLGDPKTDRTLEETVSFIAQEEQGKVTKNAVGDSVGAMCATRTNSKQSQAPGCKCWACGGSAHGQKNDRKAWSRYCEAWTFTCGKCTIKGHFTKNCSKCTTCGEWGHRDSSSRVCVKSMSHKDSSNASGSKSSTKDPEQNSDLVPVKLVMRGAIKEDLGVIGAIVVNVATRTSGGPIRSTRMLCYVSNTMEKVPFARTNYFAKSFSVESAKQWNTLPIHLRQISNINTFKTNLRVHLLNS